MLNKELYIYFYLIYIYLIGNCKFGSDCKNDHIKISNSSNNTSSNNNNSSSNN